MSVLELPSILPVGYRFHPTDEELIIHFLKQKMTGRGSQVDHIIAEVDFCKFEPWELPSKSRVKSKDKMWWFFCRRDYKYPSSARSNRKTKTGSWKITGKEKLIMGGRDGKTCIGKKKNLVFNKGPYPGKKTKWKMQEFYVEPDNLLPDQRAYVICRLKEKSEDNVETPNGDESGPTGDFASVFENQTAMSALPGVHGHPQETLDDYIAQELSFQLPIVFSGDDNLTQASWEVDESEVCLDEFADSLIVDPDENFYGGTANNVSNISFWPTSSKAFWDGPVSSDTDTEGINARYARTLETPSMFGSPGGSKRVRHMRMRKTPGETLMTSAGQDSKLETVVPVPGQFSEEDASSDDSTEYVGKFSRLTLAKEERPKSVAVSRGGHQRRIQAQKKESPPALQDNNKAKEAAKEKRSAVGIPEKEKSSKESLNVRKMVQSSSVVEKHFKSASCESSQVSKLKSFFTFEETSSLSRGNPRPPSEYCFNVVVGTILFVVLVRELVLYGSW